MERKSLKLRSFLLQPHTLASFCVHRWSFSPSYLDPILPQRIYHLFPELHLYVSIFKFNFSPFPFKCLLQFHNLSLNLALELDGDRSEREAGEKSEKNTKEKGAGRASVNHMTLGRLNKHQRALAQNMVTISTNDPESMPGFSIIELKMTSKQS